MIDLEIDTTGNPHKDLNCISNHLLSIKQRGVFLQSGDTGLGSYFFVGKSIASFDIQFRKFLGSLLAFVDTGDEGVEATINRRESLHMSEELLLDKSDDIAIKVAKEIRQIFPSIPSGHRRPGLLVDLRWVAHGLIEKRFFLRYTPGKGYKDKPFVVAEL